MPFTQDKRTLELATPLGKDKLLLTSIVGDEGISRLFRFELRMISEDSAISAKDIAGKNVTFFVKRADDSPRYFNGHVSRFFAGDEGDDGTRDYRAEVVPKLWFLTRNANCRIFQKKTVVKIIEKIFADRGITDFNTGQITGNHPEREYVVQYRETDFNFVARLCEEEGIFWFFKHDNGKHTLMLADNKSAYFDCDEKEVDYPRDFGTQVQDDHITSWEHRYEFRTGKWAHTDWNFETPGTDLMANEKTVVSLPDVTNFEFYDYPGIYTKTGDGRALVKVRMEEEEVDHDVVTATSRCKTFTPGGKFKIKQHRSESEAGKKYVITTIHHSASEPSPYETGGSADHEYQNSIQCIPDSVTFRPPRLTPKPFVQGPHTAIVVGPKGEEIYTDKYGRVKVQFHWDREGKRDENSSCWIRASQNIAGKLWGFMAIPRIGQEVVIDFFEGDPDRPLIVGSVYNAEQMPFYTLPDEKTKSYFKTNSTKGGDGYNEIRFEDKKDSEQIFIHAQKDSDERVQNDSREWIGKDRHLIVKGSQYELVEKNKHGHVKGNHQEKVDSAVSLKVGGQRDTKIGTKDAIEAGREIHLKAGMKVIIEAGMQISLVGPGGFIDIGPAGVTIQGTMVKINSGGAAGSGGGSKPTDPEPPVEADDSKTGKKSAP